MYLIGIITVGKEDSHSGHSYERHPVTWSRVTHPAQGIYRIVRFYTVNNIEILNSYTATNAEKLSAIIRSTTNSHNPESDAEKLLINLSNIKNVLEAPAETLAKYVSAGTAEKLAALLPIIRIYRAEEMEEPRKIANRLELEKYCLSLTEGRQREGFYVIAVNAQCKIISTKEIAEGSTSEVAAYPREIAKFALDVNAHCVFLCHNHPGGTCAPSMEDIQTTTQIQRLLCSLQIRILDHMITANGRAYSMAQHGDIEFNR